MKRKHLSVHNEPAHQNKEFKKDPLETSHQPKSKKPTALQKIRASVWSEKIYRPNG